MRLKFVNEVFRFFIPYGEGIFLGIYVLVDLIP